MVLMNKNMLLRVKMLIYNRWNRGREHWRYDNDIVDDVDGNDDDFDDNDCKNDYVKD